ncbi:MAG TPA: sulfite exporter TauE/SafE family protein, partial [Solirubrobacteraceae bacterium]
HRPQHVHAVQTRLPCRRPGLRCRTTLGTIASHRSGQLREPSTRRTAKIIAAVALIGTPVGVIANGFVSGAAFGILLAIGAAVAGVPVLSALGAAQAQSVVIAATGTIGYLIHGSIDWPLAAVVGLPELAGVLAGHRLAHAVPARWLTYALGLALIALAPWLVLHG